MARSLNVKIVGDASSYQHALKQVSDSNTKAARGFKQLSTAAKIGIGVGLTAAAAGAVKATQAASDLGESINAVNVIFGKGSKQVQQFTKHAYEIGLSTRAANEAVTPLGATFRNVGLGADETAKKAVALTKRAADMASVFNTSVPDALEAVQAGLRGEADPLERYGVGLSDAAVKAKAAALGFKLVKGNLDPQAKALARYAVLMEQTNRVQGDFRKTSGGLANQSRILKARLENIAASIGTVLIPIATAGAKALQKVFDFVGKIADAPNVTVAFQIATQQVKDIAGRIKTAITNAIDSVDWKPVGMQLASTIGSSITFGANVLDGALDAMLKWVNAHAAQLAEVGALLTIQIVSTLTDPAFWIKHWELALSIALLAFSRGLSRIAGRFGAILLERLGPVFTKGFEDVVLRGMTALDRLPNLISAALTLAVGAAARGVQAIVSEVARAPGLIAKAFRLGVVITAVRVAFEELKRIVSGAFDWIVEKALIFASSFLNSMTKAFGWIPGIGGRLKDARDAINKQLEKIRFERTAQQADNLAGKIDAIRRGLHSLPNDITIQFIVKTLTMSAAQSTGPRGFGSVGGHAAGGRIPGARTMADSVPAMLSPGEFVVTGGGERMLERMTFPGVLDWLQGRQPPHFAGGGRVNKRIEYDRLYPLPAVGGAVSMHGLVPQVQRALAWARSHGWGGAVTSGFRTYAEQAALYARYLAGGPLAAKPGTSSHERGQAVDVSDYGTFGGTMASAPPGSRIYNRLGARDPVHFSVSGYQGGGRVVGPGSGRERPRVDVPTPSPLAGLRRRIRALRAEERQLKAAIAVNDRAIRQLDKVKKPTKAQKAKRRQLVATSNRLHARLRTVQAQLQSLNQRVQEVVQHDYSELPISIQLEQAQAALTEGTEDDLRALLHAQTYLETQLRRPGITGAQRVQLLRALAGVRGDIASLTKKDETTTGGAGTGDTADLQAQLAQANARAAASAESARLANAFVSTGVFGGGVGMYGSLGAGAGGNTIVFNNLIPDADQIQRATAAIAVGAGAQPYRTSSLVKTGY